LGEDRSIEFNACHGKGAPEEKEETHKQQGICKQPKLSQQQEIQELYIIQDQQELADRQELLEGQELRDRQELLEGQELRDQQKLFQELLDRQELLEGQELRDRQELLDGQELLDRQELHDHQETLKQEKTYEQTEEQQERNKHIYVAVATKSGVLVDQHFGQVSEFYIFEYRNGTAQFKERRVVEKYCNGALDCDEKEDKITSILKTISDCIAVVAMRIGESPKSKLKEKGIHVLATYDRIEDSVIKAVIECKLSV
jgi:predicted Fe-Mo cluster-binding NifX family protein